MGELDFVDSNIFLEGDFVESLLGQALKIDVEELLRLERKGWGRLFFFISIISETDMSLPLEILKLQNLMVWSNWSIFSLNTYTEIVVLVFINYYWLKIKLHP